MQFSEKELTKLSRVIFFVYRLLGLIRVTEKRVEGEKEKNVALYESSNFTIINFYLIKMGPTREYKLTFNLLMVQVKLQFYHRVYFN